MKVLPVGSVVRAGKNKLLIAGYQIFYEEQRVDMGYLAVKYPRGYAGKESLGILRFSEVEETLAEGLHTPGEKRYTEGLGRFWERAGELDPENWERFMKLLAEKAKERTEAAEAGAKEESGPGDAKR